ncbi:hypothetical protein [Streptomyces mutabilis]|uniref:hypothetical protein n=1 Tax=Streptomyces mutabilis TaxID=67332 RepID=UPI00198BA912|nr:hypothetical protein GCM10010279_05500 [Streptomyces mutabilis]
MVTLRDRVSFPASLIARLPRCLDGRLVSVHLALGDRTRGLLGPAELFRAAIVDQDTLLASLREATPHLGYVSRTDYATYYGQAVEAIRAYLAGSPGTAPARAPRLRHRHLLPLPRPCPRAQGPDAQAMPARTD